MRFPKKCGSELGLSSWLGNCFRKGISLFQKWRLPQTIWCNCGVNGMEIVWWLSGLANSTDECTTRPRHWFGDYKQGTVKSLCAVADFFLYSWKYSQRSTGAIVWPTQRQWQRQPKIVRLHKLMSSCRPCRCCLHMKYTEGWTWPLWRICPSSSLWLHMRG